MKISPLQKAIEEALNNGRHAVIPFITAGFPDKESFWTQLNRIDASGADIIEIGVPFSDPVADGPVIEQASRNALKLGVTLKWILDGLKQRKGRFRAKLVLMGYVNPFYQYGLEQLAKDAVEAGVSGFIVPDMLLEETDLFRNVFDAYGLDIITLVAPNTTKERMEEYKPYTRGFVYVVSVLGTTGGKTNVAVSVADTLRRAREVFDVPLALGFGLQIPQQLDVLPDDVRPDAAVLGTALLKHIADGGAPADFLAPWVR
jgi:tryptophan synthase alpha chain